MSGLASGKTFGTATRQKETVQALRRAEPARTPSARRGGGDSRLKTAGILLLVMAAGCYLLTDQLLATLFVGGAGLTLLILAFTGGAGVPNKAAAVAPGAAGSSLDRFVEEFERSGRGWFWETDPAGTLTYLSADLAERVGLKNPAGDDLSFCSLFADEIGEADDGLRSERTVGFHLSVRTPFAEVVVRPKGQDKAWWSISGRPIFDSQGEFLGFRGTGADLSEARYAEAEVRRLARHDSLTGLCNRSAMTKSLEEALRTARGTGTRCALMLLDLDRFKAVNDSHGHMVGDELLKQVAKRLQEVAGKVGQVGRLGGDEFKIVIPNPPSPEALGEIADRCISYVSIPYRIGARTFQVGASVGIALAGPNDNDPDVLMRRADLALYAAKGNGRGTHRFFEPEMQTVAQDRQVLEQDLKQAISDGELELYYQPVVSSASEQLTGFEALLRWHHPVQGPISPAICIPIAEETGLIIPLGEWAIRTACAAAAAMPQHIRVAVNLSPIQFSNPNLPNVIVSALASAGLPASRLELEITEGVFLEQDPATQERFDRLKAIGVRLALDDFGTGYASLGYLKTAPFDKIKIDQSFVRGATHQGSRNMRILSAIVGLAQSLGMDTTAEGAETFDELQLIRELGCSHVQGYIFGRPMPFSQALELARKSPTVEVDGFARARPPRQRLIRKGQLHHEDGVYEAIIRNVSDGGALIETERGFPPDTPVVLEVAGCGLFQAEVCWAQGQRVGLRFTEAFDLARLNPGRAPPSALRAGRA
jgi:diguanylate cyclase (GGDEF)-like protein